MKSFAPVVGRGARLLILGSMPGEASLAAGQYYAHPRNDFWPIVGRVLDFDPAAPYRQRLSALRKAGIALWDVLQSCERPGSLDASIRRDTQVPNDFAWLLGRHRGIGCVLLNGAKAEECFRRHVLAAGVGEGLPLRRMPSTSPANASWSRARKLAAWRRAILAAAKG